MFTVPDGLQCANCKQLFLDFIPQMNGERNSVLKGSYRATIGYRPILPLFTRGSVYFKTLIACEYFFYAAQMSVLYIGVVKNTAAGRRNLTIWGATW